ncbi:MAG: ubiquinone-binding protein [Rhodospirillaceae bacterium]|nr:ubiquinone-binding protein [Rhodospirillaceae bacterium]|tara:strand:+ start:223 stop:669 length:447 start_codon:yes stop_codon:yes gene_type:complete
MTTHSEKRIVPFTADQLFDLVADVENYPKFLPWCLGSRIRSTSETLIIADLLIGYKVIRERFTSRVCLDRRNCIIETEFTDGPFKFLNNRWLFAESPEGCVIDFSVHFEFRSSILQNLVDVLFQEVVVRMVGAFEDRAYRLYERKRPL